MRSACGWDEALWLLRPGLIIGPGDNQDSWTCRPVRAAETPGHEVTPWMHMTHWTPPGGETLAMNQVSLEAGVLAARHAGA